MITGRCWRRERDLLALTRQMVRPVIGILTGHTQVQQHLSLMGLSNDPFCSYCKEAIESASHFFCHCNYFTSLRTTVWGKPSLHPTDINSVTVEDIVRFVKKSHRFSSNIQWQLEFHRGWHTHTHTQPFYCSSGICLGPPGWAGTRKVKPGRLKPIWIYWSKI